MTPQQHADHLLSVWRQRRDLGIPPELRLVQDNKSEDELNHQLRMIEIQMAGDAMKAAIDNAYSVGVKLNWNEIDELNLIDLHTSQQAAE